MTKITAEEANQIRNSLIRDSLIITGSEWKYLSAATQTRVKMRYQYNAHRIWKLVFDEIIEPFKEIINWFVSVIRELTDAITPTIRYLESQKEKENE